ncbi:MULTISPECIES: class A beta-lactamase [Rhizobium]|uniref:class A beta-lactamase n=1 Tax=Rhizobium TaxID=379 RepID=UPI001B343438|nr:MULTISPECIES: class A beta-lactamase [Rhizobium]MBX4908229.1 class A beta-lactamase [Rhizobium bangladeshense]MBX5217113.1 class A beta-lactamase [Rhizobium sp. NLR9a]MBX5222467.1 class A beta-lactamase [Rhizobium sp. NLR8a]MBX5227769.1 class A beta-lactamase [Rhizobium sp. NLR9b]MBX5233444.1 class A beta-lactamase [Rhizobium sp. NLR4a]
MDISLTRRTLIGSVLCLPALSLSTLARAANAQETAGEGDDNIEHRLAALEKRTGGRLGVSVLDTQTSISFGYRGSEAFPMCSTFKALAAGFVLARADKGQESLERRVTYGSDKLVDYSPVSEKHAGADGMTLAELCEAAVTVSDNTAGNLLLESFGGPPALTDWLRSIGDGTTRLDRTEPTLNEGRKGDPRDTTAPDAMLDTLGNLTLGSVLTGASCDKLIAWLVASTTGKERLRAGLPADWKVGDKTGTGQNGSLGDIAVIWPPDRGPIVAAVYIAEATVPAKELNLIFAEVGKMVTEMV